MSKSVAVWISFADMFIAMLQGSCMKQWALWQLKKQFTWPAVQRLVADMPLTPSVSHCRLSTNILLFITRQLSIWYATSFGCFLFKWVCFPKFVNIGLSSQKITYWSGWASLLHAGCSRKVVNVKAPRG